MCGIIGYIGNKQPKDILLKGLSKLEYRGYDSAGIALRNFDYVQVIRSVGKISNLRDKLNSINLIDADMGIAHTRWATHGEASEVNAHPHTVGRVTLVHNGIIENYASLKKFLEEQGVIFKSDTDTEVAAALIDYYYDDDIELAINKAILEIEGSYAFGIIFSNNDNLYAIRKGSPLYIGVLDEEKFIASDLCAIVDYTDKYIFLEEDELAIISKNNVVVKKQDIEIFKDIKTASIECLKSDKCGYDHYMLKEIMEEPLVLEKTLKPFIDDLSLLPDLTSYKEIHIVACGSAMYAGMIGKSLLEEKANIKVILECASEYRYNNVIYDCKTLVILVSQSGETADTIAAMRKAKENNIDTLAIVNVKTSTIALESDRQIFIEAGSEIAVATTKAYILQVAILALLSYKAMLIKNSLENDSKIEKELRLLPRLVKEVLDRRGDYLKIAKEIYKNEDVFFIGRKIDYATSLEGSLKLKEISYIHSEAYQAGELKHGTISLINKDYPVFAIITDPVIKSKTLSNVSEVKSRGAKVIIISNERIDGYDQLVMVPKISEYFQPILIVPVLQLIAYEVAVLRGCNIDQPKNLAKSVTVE